MINDSQQITRQIMGNVPSWLATAFYVSAAAACVWSVLALAWRFRKHRQGRPTPSRESKPWGARVAVVLRYLTFHQQLLRDRYAGLAHLLLFYGFFILFLGTCLVLLEYDTPLHFFYGRFYLVASLGIDLGGIAFLVGLLMFLHRRLFGNSPRILRRAYVAALLWLLLAIGVTGFALEGARIAVDRPNFERWSVGGYAIATVINWGGITGDVALRWHRFAWGFHALLCVVFFALLPWRFFSHMVFGPVSWALRTDHPRAALRPVELKFQSDANDLPGATSWRELPWIDLLQADACTTCGRCNAVCPADSAGKPLHPREIVLGVRHAMNQPGATEFTSLVDDDALWSCTTCGACDEVCPVGIEVVDKIVELRRGRVESGCVPAAAATRFESSASEFNPFQEPSAARMNWAAGLKVPVAEPIELLYWVGCAGSFDPDGRNVSRAMIKILNHLGVAYHLLGPCERCTGDPLRRMGEEGLFQELARQYRNARQPSRAPGADSLPPLLQYLCQRIPATGRGLIRSGASQPVPRTDDCRRQTPFDWWHRRESDVSRPMLSRSR